MFQGLDYPARHRPACNRSELLSLGAEDGTAKDFLAGRKNGVEFSRAALRQKIRVLQLAPSAVAGGARQAFQVLHTGPEPEAIQGQLGRRPVPAREVFEERIKAAPNCGSAFLAAIRVGYGRDVWPPLPAGLINVKARVGGVGLAAGLFLNV